MYIKSYFCYLFNHLCTAIKAFFTAVKAITTMYTWEEVRDPVVEVCHQIFNQSENYVRHDVLCPGVVDLQGPHVSNTKLFYVFCSNLISKIGHGPMLTDMFIRK